MSGLKPCPFCGGEVRHRLIHGGAYNEDLYAICCKSCNVTMETDGTLTEQDITDWNTRAVPDVPELVRYDTPYDFRGRPIAGMVPIELGEYVRYDQAAAIIAAKDGVQKQWQDISKHYTGYENPSMAFRVLIERAEAAEAKLAQYEAQEPVITAEVTRLGTDYRCHSSLKIGTHPLYASPAPAADLKAQYERLREALKQIKNNAIGSMVPSSVIAALVEDALDGDTNA